MERLLVGAFFISCYCKEEHAYNFYVDLFVSFTLLLLHCVGISFVPQEAFISGLLSTAGLSRCIIFSRAGLRYRSAVDL
jgi:hypothetical protein